MFILLNHLTVRTELIVSVCGVYHIVMLLAVTPI
jgi:hypothetical protein